MSDLPETPSDPHCSAPSSFSQSCFSALAFLVISIFLLFIIPTVAERTQYAITRGYQRARADVAKDLLAELPDAESRIPYVAKAIEPSVVWIETSQYVPDPHEGEDLDSQMWADQLESEEFQTEGLGSGVIVDPDGHIVTNCHVIDDATKVTVKLSDGTVISNVRVVGVDRATDLAVLKISGENLVAAPWGDSDALEVGDTVVAVGNPYGFARSVTSGIISATDRYAHFVGRPYEDLLQTDAAVNPGNSGGPLVNMKGEIIGVNTAIFGEGYQGISFAIPSRLVREVYEEIKSRGHVRRGWLGVEMSNVEEDDVESLGLENASGAMVGLVLPDSPATQAGFQRNDVIVEWDGEPVTSSLDLRRAVARTKVDSEVAVVVFRDGSREELFVKVGERSPQLIR